MRREVNVLALLNGAERYVFVYDEASRPELIDTFRQWAADPQLGFNWFDAALMTEKARQQAAVAAEKAAPSKLSRIAEV